MAQYDVDLREYWRILKKRKLIVILMVCLVGIFSYGFAKLKEPLPLYETSTSVKIERSHNMAGLTGFFWNETENIVTQAFIITSFPVLIQTAKITGMIPSEITEQEIRNTKSYLDVIQRLKAMIQAEQEQGTRIVNIRVTSSDKQEAAFVANSVARAFQEHNIQERNRQTFETREFIEKQLEVTSRRLKEAEEKLRVFKESYSLVALDDQTSRILAQLSNVEAQHGEVKRKKEIAAAQIKLLELKSASPETLQETFMTEIEVGQLRSLSTKLSDLILKRKALLFDFTERHPQVIEVNDQIKSVLIEIKNELTTYLKGQASLEADLYRRLLRLRRENQSLPDKALQLERLQREVGLQESLYSQLKTKYQEVLIQESGKVQEVVIVRPALVPQFPTNIPSKLMIIATGVLMGLIIGIVFTFIAETLDTSIGTIEDVESLLNVPVQGLIPILGAEQRDKSPKKKDSDKGIARYLITHYDPKSLVAEAFRSLRTNLQFVGKDRQGKSFLVTSSFIQEGKTFNVVNIALSMAQTGQKVLLVEADLRRPTVHTTFGLPKDPGLTDYVLGNYHWREVVNTITDVMLGDFEIEDILKTQGMDNLHIITAGTNPLNPIEILRSTRFQDFIKEAYDEYDFIFVDAPPVMPVADATEIAPLLDGVILVYKVGKIGRGVLKRAKMALDNVKAAVVGVVLNNVRPEVGPDYFKYQTQYYYEPQKQFEEDLGERVKESFRKFKRRKPPFGKYFRLAVLILAVALLLLGIFWKDLLKDIIGLATFMR